MLEPEDKRTPRRIFEHYVHKFMLTRCIRKADVRIFTQSYYRKRFLKEEKVATLINPATWVDRDHLVDAVALQERFANRSGPLNLFFPARLLEEKGVYLIFELVKVLQQKKISCRLTIMGVGGLQQECRTFAANDYGCVEANYLEPVEYGQPFFQTLSSYDVVLVPNLKHEQPRIIFDAFSQGVGIIGSDKSGILDITNDENSLIFPANDVHAFAEAVELLVNNPDKILHMGIAAQRYAAGKTHQQMHSVRADFLQAILMHE